MRGVALPLRQPSRVASDKVCGFKRQRNLYREWFLRQSLRVLRILRETSFISNRRYNTLTQTAPKTPNYRSYQYSSRWRWNTQNCTCFTVRHAGCERSIINKRTRRHGGLEILAIRYLWNKANSFVFFLRELINGHVPGCIAP